MIGRVVGSYEIVERIGEGGMGTVYRALDPMLEREVAVKAIQPDLARDPQVAERFRAEAKLLARVNHPAIATIYSFFREGEELFLAMEFVRGRALASVLREEGPLPWRQAVQLLAAALEGIEQVANRMAEGYRRFLEPAASAGRKLKPAEERLQIEIEDIASLAARFRLRLRPGAPPPAVGAGKNRRAEILAHAGAWTRAASASTG